MAPGEIAVVTGSTGYVGAELVKQLLEQGYTVRGTVRGSTTSDRAKALQGSLPAASLDRLTLHAADLLEPGSFDAVVDGADYVFHVASPFQVEVSDPETDLLRPALEGTRNVLSSVAKYKERVKRVVLTSSVAAVHDIHCKQPPAQGELYTEADFNDASKPPEEAYWVSKVVAEREAWALASAHGFSLVTILPDFVMGPVLNLPTAASSLSAGFFKGFLEAPGGKVPSGSWIFADVRDVAAAHILAAQTPAASGRYIVASSKALDAKDVSTILKDAFPKLALVEGEAAPKKFNLDNSKAPRELGLKLHPVEETLRDMASSLIEIGFAHPKPAAA